MNKNTIKCDQGKHFHKLEYTTKIIFSLSVHIPLFKFKNKKVFCFSHILEFLALPPTLPKINKNRHFDAFKMSYVVESTNTR